jgi:competence protein ComEC
VTTTVHAADEADQSPPDLRLLVPAVAAWAGTLSGTLLSTGGAALVSGAVAIVAAGFGLRRGGRRLVAGAALICFLAGAGSGAARVLMLDQGPVAVLADARAYVSVQATLTDDPILVSAKTPPAQSYVVARTRVEQISGRGQVRFVRAPILLIAGRELLRAVPGQRLKTSGRLGPADSSEGLAAILRTRDRPVVIAQPSWLQRWTEPLRQGLRSSVDRLPAGPRGLVPALVVGDRSRLPPEVTEDMRVAGLLHLNAVSGANVAIVLAGVLGVARRLGVRGYGLPVIGGAAVLAFVVLARPQPSVLRAAAMGLVVLVAQSAGGTRRGLVSLAAAVLALVLMDPFLGRSIGFALSVLATAGILTLGPRWTTAASAWLPRTLAAALAVPLAAQLACTPLVVAVSGQLSVVALFANILVAPAVAPATIAGAAAAVISPIWLPAGTLLGFAAGIPAWWIVVVADAAAAFPGAATAVSTRGVGRICLLLVLTLLAAWAVSRALRSGWLTVALVAVLVVAIWEPARLSWLHPGPSWPPPTWVFAACSVGQGDALAIRTGTDAAIVVDSGPDPRLVDHCLDDLGVRTVPTVVLTHFHADHVEGLTGVLEDRTVGELLVSPLADPPAEAARVRAWATAAGVPVVEARPGLARRTEDVAWEVIWPTRLMRDTESPPNNASVVLKAQVGDLSVLLTGDIEPEAQGAILRSGVDLASNVLKVPHHGSSHQHDAFLDAVDPSLAIVSVGADNPHGHPSSRIIRLLERAGAVVVRTDQRGSVALMAGSQEIRVAQSGPPP